MALKGITFSGQNVSPKNDGGLYAAHYGDGILSGCSMSVSGSNLVVQRGQIIACGRVCEFDGATNISLSGHGLTTGYIQVVLNVDISQPAGSQWYTTTDTSNDTSFLPLTQDNVNGTDTLYQVELAVVQVIGGNLTAVARQLRGSDLIISTPGGVNELTYIKNGTQIAKVSTTAASHFRAGVTNADGNALRGIGAESGGGVELFDNGNDITIRPNGIISTTGMTTFAANGDVTITGQVFGGHQVLTSDKTTSTNLTANTWSGALCTVTLTPGVWVLTGTANIKCLGTSSTNWAMINLGHSTASNTARSSAILSGSTAVYLGLNASLIIEVTASTYTMDLYAQAEANTSVSSAYLRAIQIG